MKHYLIWWLAGAVCQLLLFILMLPALLAMGLIKVLGMGADRAEMELALSAAEVRTRREKNQFKGFWK
jgi:hypothetical protein